MVLLLLLYCSCVSKEYGQMHRRFATKREAKLRNLLSTLTSSEQQLVESGLLDASSCLDYLGDTSFIQPLSSSISTPTFTSISDDTLPSSSAIPLEIEWETLPIALDPAAGEIEKGSSRVTRKRQQVASLIQFVEEEIAFLRAQRKVKDKVNNDSKLRIVEFGAGSGHVGLLLAFRNPDVHVTLCERKVYSVQVARERVASLGLSDNVDVFCGDLRDLPPLQQVSSCQSNTFSSSSSSSSSTSSPTPPSSSSLSSERSIPLFHIGIGLHCCGLLTDLALRMCCQEKASFVIVPCCYGQITNPPPR